MQATDFLGIDPVKTERLSLQLRRVGQRLGETATTVATAEHTSLETSTTIPLLHAVADNVNELAISVDRASSDLQSFTITDIAGVGKRPSATATGGAAGSDPIEPSGDPSPLPSARNSLAPPGNGVCIPPGRLDDMAPRNAPTPEPAEPAVPLAIADPLAAQIAIAENVSDLLDFFYGTVLDIDGGFPGLTTASGAPMPNGKPTSLLGLMHHLTLFSPNESIHDIFANDHALVAMFGEAIQTIDPNFPDDQLSRLLSLLWVMHQ